jgi:hypothetical protein
LRNLTSLDGPLLGETQTSMQTSITSDLRLAAIANRTLAAMTMSVECPEAEVIGAFGHGVEAVPTTARGTLRAIL